MLFPTCMTGSGTPRTSSGPNHWIRPPWFLRWSGSLLRASCSHHPCSIGLNSRNGTFSPLGRQLSIISLVPNGLPVWMLISFIHSHPMDTYGSHVPLMGLPGKLRTDPAPSLKKATIKYRASPCDSNSGLRKAPRSPDLLHSS
jgi:hypothetical protein